MSADTEKRYEVELSATVYTSVKLVSFAYYGWDDEPSAVMVESVNEVEE